MEEMTTKAPDQRGNRGQRRLYFATFLVFLVTGLIYGWAAFCDSIIPRVAPRAEIAENAAFAALSLLCALIVALRLKSKAVLKTFTEDENAGRLFPRRRTRDLPDVGVDSTEIVSRDRDAR